MSVFKRKDRTAWSYEFQYQGNTYRGNTRQLTRDDAVTVEQREKERVRRREAGIADLRDAPPFQLWSGVYYEYKATSTRRVKRPDQIDFLVRTVLKFWGARPTDPAKVDDDAPYHDLTLADPILEPAWLQRFETWMTQQGFSGSHKNHLRTQLSGMYKVAALPEHRKRTGLTAAMNPLLGVPRDRQRARDVVLSPAQVRRWIRHAAYHVRLALAIAALAPKLRLGNILALRWDQQLDRQLTRITVTDHKTDQETGRPLVVLVSPQLRRILKDARTRAETPYVIEYQGRRSRSIRDGLRFAAARAKIPFGRRTPDGATFHTIRHAVATWLAEMEDLTEPMRAALLAHRDIATTQRYTHLRPVREQAALAQLSALLPIEQLVTGKPRRQERRQDPDRHAPKRSTKSAKPRASSRRRKRVHR